MRPEPPFSFDVRDVSPPQNRQILLAEEPSLYTPRSKSLDLLRAGAPSPVTARTSFDTISTVRCRHISSPIFLNSSIGVKPLPEEPGLESSLPELDEDEGGSDTFGSSARSVSVGKGLGVVCADLRASTMPRYLTRDAAVQPKTPSRRQNSTDQLRSKFSMSPVQQSKRSKTRISEDRSSSKRLTEGLLSHDGSRSTLGNWSHSLGMAARKLQRSALPRKASDESQGTLEVTQVVNDRLATPEKANSSLRTAASIASIRRFM